MIKLYGTSISNYFSAAKTALMEKGIPFEEVRVFPSQDEKLISLNPMGKVPFIEVEGKVLSETRAIFDYLEDIAPEPALYPADPWARAKARELIQVVELYLDAPARRHIAAVYFGGETDPATVAAVKPELDKGIRTLRALARFAPYIAGDTFSFADIAAYFHINFTNLHTRKVYERDLRDEVPGLGAYLAMVGERPSIKAVDAILQRDFKAFTSR